MPDILEKLVETTVKGGVEAAKKTVNNAIKGAVASSEHNNPQAKPLRKFVVHNFVKAVIKQVETERRSDGKLVDYKLTDKSREKLKRLLESQVNNIELDAPFEEGVERRLSNLLAREINNHLKSDPKIEKKLLLQNDEDTHVLGLAIKYILAQTILLKKVSKHTADPRDYSTSEAINELGQEIIDLNAKDYCELVRPLVEAIKGYHHNMTQVKNRWNGFVIKKTRYGQLERLIHKLKSFDEGRCSIILLIDEVKFISQAIALENSWQLSSLGAALTKFISETKDKKVAETLANMNSLLLKDKREWNERYDLLPKSFSDFMSNDSPSQSDSEDHSDVSPSFS